MRLLAEAAVIRCAWAYLPAVFYNAKIMRLIRLALANGSCRMCESMESHPPPRYRCLLKRLAWRLRKVPLSVRRLG
ncbi:hypothetical protein EMIT0373P_10799 [Pseudomonas chlororaphis]